MKGTEARPWVYDAIVPVIESSAHEPRGAAEMRVLVVDDDPSVRGVVRRSLEREGFEVVEAGDGDEAIQRSDAAWPDVAVLDLNMPGMSGIDLMAELRRRDPTLHTIMLTGAGSEAERVAGLVSGADDYVVKPFSPRELAARLIALRRRSEADQPVEPIEVGGLRIDPAAREAFIGDEPVDLTRREFDLLSHLASNPGRSFTREELLRAVWGSSAEWQSPATVTEHVRRLRSKIELDPGRPVRLVTVRGSGYRFDPVVRDTSTRDGAASAPRAGAPPVAHAEDPVFVVVGNEVVDASSAALALLGADQREQVVGHDVFEFIAPQSLGASVARQQHIKEGRWPRPEVLTVLRRDGQEVLVEIASTQVLWDGQPASQIQVWDLGGDTSKLRELATGIRTHVADAVIITDAQLRIQSFNPAAEELYGWREDEVVGLVTMEVLPWLRDDSVADDARDAFQRDGRWHGEVTQRRRDGNLVRVRASSTLLRDNAGQPVGVITVSRPIERTTSVRAVERPSADELLEREIRSGLERGEFVVHYQPVVRLDDGAWVGAEGLVRWNHPERGLLPPGAFMNVAERSGAIVDLGQRVLDEACQQWARWAAAGRPDLHVAVNLSARQLSDPELPALLRDVMASVSMPPGTLWLEVTETSLVEDVDAATEVLRRITALGAQVSIDDFGTGWASLTYLRAFPVHSLKIDRSFVQGLGSSDTDTAIVRSVLSLGSELALSVIAEGIETREQMAHLTVLGCELGQGYLLGRPLPPDQLDPAQRR